MKWILYWTYYISSITGEYNMSGIIAVTKDSVYCYIAPYQYTSFKIDYIRMNVDGDNIITNLILLGSKPHCKISILLIGDEIKQSLFIQHPDMKYTDHVTMKKKQNIGHKRRRQNGTAN